MSLLYFGLDAVCLFKIMTGVALSKSCNSPIQGKKHDLSCFFGLSCFFNNTDDSQDLSCVFTFDKFLFFVLFAAKKRKLTFSVFCIYTYICIKILAYVYIYMLCFKRKSEAQAIFLNQFTICSSCKRKFVICPFVDEETNGIC
jgi:hypothetical protein